MRDDSVLTIIKYHTRGQTVKTIIDYHEEFEQTQNEQELIVDDSTS